jgi:hypothetical protein
VKTTLETSGEDVKTTLETSVLLRLHWLKECLEDRVRELEAAFSIGEISEGVALVLRDIGSSLSHLLSLYGWTIAGRYEPTDAFVKDNLDSEFAQVSAIKGRELVQNLERGYPHFKTNPGPFAGQTTEEIVKR